MFQDGKVGSFAIAFANVMSISTGVIRDHDGVLFGVEREYLACGGEVYMFLCCIEAFDASFDAAADVVECVFALLFELDVVFLVFVICLDGESVWVGLVLFG